MARSVTDSPPLGQGPGGRTPPGPVKAEEELDRRLPVYDVKVPRNHFKEMIAAEGILDGTAD